MTWHPATGLGLIGLGNLRYAPCRPVVDEQLRALVLADAVPRRRVRPAAAVRAFRPVMEGLLTTAWDDAVADAAFAMNMDLDEPREVRRAAVERVVAELGPFRPDATRPESSDVAGAPRLVAPRRAGLGAPRAPRDARAGATGAAVHRRRAVPDPSDALVAIADRILAAAGSPTPAWPDDVAAGPELDVAPDRALDAGRRRRGSGRCGAGLPIAGDGTTTATFEIDGEDGRAELKVVVDADSGRRDRRWSLSAAEREAAPRGLVGGQRQRSGGVHRRPDRAREPLEHREPVEPARDLRRAQRDQALGGHEVRQDPVQDRLDLVAERVVGGAHPVGLERHVREQADDEVVGRATSAGPAARRRRRPSRRTSAGSRRSCPSRRDRWRGCRPGARARAPGGSG